MTTSTSVTTRIEVLTKENYDTWKMQVEALLTKNDLWEYVSGDTSPPVAGEAGAAADAARASFRKYDKKAKSDLILSIHPSELPQIRGCETSREVWLKLESIYASKGPARKAALLKQLMLQRLQEGGDVRVHMAHFFEAVDKLAAMEVEINGDLLSIMLLYSLPSSYDNFRVAIESRDELPTPDALKVKILEESEVRRQASVVEAASALAINRGGGNDRRRSRRRKSKPVSSEAKSEGQQKIHCYTCGAPGHKSPDCPDKKSQQSRDKQKPSANAVDDSYAVCSMAAFDSSVSMLASETSASRPWILDSGCTSHLCGDASSFKTLERSRGGRLKLASQASADVKGKGTVRMAIAGDTSTRRVEFNNTLFVPDLRTNLVSVAKIADRGHTVSFHRDFATAADQSGQVKLTADRKGDLYYIRESAESAALAQGTSELMKWHERLGHLNLKDLLKVVRENGSNAVAGSPDDVLKCEVCMKGKMTALPFPQGNPPCTELLKIVHSDVVGPVRVKSPSGARFFVTFVDDASRWCQVYFLGQKSGVLEAFERYKKLVENQTGRKIKCLQSDNGREYCNQEFDSLLSNHGIERRLTVPRTPQQNGVAERLNRTILSMARCLLMQSGLPLTFWTDAVATACYLRNRCPTKPLDGLTPYEKWTGEAPTLDHLRVFGSTVYVLDKAEGKDKFADRANKGVFIGYPRETKGYRVWISEARKTVVARDVKFLEETVETSNNDARMDLLEGADPDGDATGRRVSLKSIELKPVELPSDEPEAVRVPQEAAEQPQAIIPVPRGRGRPRILRTGSRGRPRKEYQTLRSAETVEDVPIEISDDDLEDDVFAGAAEVSVTEAMSSGERNEWSNAILSEIRSLVKNDTLEIVTKSKRQNIVGSRLVLTNKYKADGSIERRKARIVAKGYSQRFGVDYHQTFAPVARLESIRLMMAIAVQYGLTIHQFDIVTAYLNAHLAEEVIMEIPDYMEEMLEKLANNEDESAAIRTRAKKMMAALHKGGNACRLKKALYGLRQAGREWHLRLSQKLKSLALKPTIGEPCLYVAHREEDILLLLVYVDDILVAS